MKNLCTPRKVRIAINVVTAVAMEFQLTANLAAEGGVVYPKGKTWVAH